MNSVRDLMSNRPDTVSPDLPLEDCARRMLRTGRRHLPVVEEGKVLGVVFDLDVFRAGTLVGADGDQWMGRSPATTAGEAAKAVDVMAVMDDPLDDWLDRITNTAQDVTVVFDAEGDLQGILTEHDGVRLAAFWLEEGMDSDHVSSEALTINRYAPITEALDAMLEAGQRHILAVDPDGTAVGVVSIRDAYAASTAVRVEEAMSPRIITLEAPANLREAARMMTSEKFGCIPLLKDGKPVGMLTRVDLLRAMAAGLRGAAPFKSTQPPTESRVG